MPVTAYQVVKAAEKKILEKELSGQENKEYLGMEGLPAFNKVFQRRQN